MQHSPGPSDIELSTYGLVMLISFWGGLVNFLNRIKKNKSPTIDKVELLVDLFMDLVISGFSGLLVFWVCTWKGLDPLLASVITGVAGHLGTRTIFLFEEVFEKYVRRFADLDDKDLID